MVKVSELVSGFEKRWPLSAAADWDRPGLSLGGSEAEVVKVLLAVDVTKDVLEQAKQQGAQLVFTHHPLLMRGVNYLPEQSLKGSLVSTAIRSNIAIYSAHTNADFALGGVSESLAELLGLTDTGPLTEGGEGVVGTIPQSSLLDYARALARLLPSCAQGILVQGDPARIISKVGLVAGAGDSYLDAASKAGIDLFITSDLRHHPASDFGELGSISHGPALISIPHFAAEWPWLAKAAAELRLLFPSVEFVVSEINTDPWDFAVMQ